MASAARLMTRAQLGSYLGGLPWAELAGRMAAGKLPRPLWRLDPADKNARWDVRAVDRALDAESGVPATIEAQERALDRSLGLS